MSVRFDAGGDRLARTTGLPGSQPYTVCGWALRARDTNTYSCLTLLIGGPSYVYVGTDSDGDSLRSFSHNGDAAVVATLGTGGWFFWAYVANAGIQVLSHAPGGGALGSRTVNASGLLSASLWTVGNNDILTQPFDGRLTALKAWDAALSQAELEAEMAAAAPVRTADLH